MNVVTFLKKIIHTGLSPDTAPDIRFRVITVNILTLITAPVAFILGILFYALSGELILLIATTIESMAFLSILLLNKKHHYVLAALCVQGIHSLATIFFGVLLGSAVEACILSVFLIGLALMILPGGKAQTICIAGSIVILILVEINKRMGYFPAATFSPTALDIIHYSAIMVIICLCLLIILFYVRNNENLLRKLKSYNANLEHLVQQRTEELEKANQAIITFLRDTSHEIRNPLNAIYGISQLMMMETRDHTVPDPVRSLTTHLHTSCYNVIQIINNILELSKIKAGKTDIIKKEPLELKDWITDIRTTYQYLADLKQVKIRADIDKALPDVIMTDKIKLTQIVNNLLINAIKFTEENSQVSIRLLQEEQLFCIAITDEGIPGICPDKAARLFEPFISESNGFLAGTGLGLPITRRFVGLLDGDIRVENMDFKGTRFTVCLPLEAGQASVYKEEVKEREERKILFRNKTILVMEDSRLNQMLLSHFLQRWECQIEIADNGRIGFAKAQEKKPDIILLDMHMPEMDGPATLAALKNDPVLREVPVIMISADPFDDTVDRMLQAGASDYLVKPVLFQTLSAKLFPYLNEKEPVTAH